MTVPRTVCTAMPGQPSKKKLGCDYLAHVRSADRGLRMSAKRPLTAVDC